MKLFVPSVIATLIGTPSLAASDLPAPGSQSSRAADGSHDFDFEIGTWTAHVRRLVAPLTGSRRWVDYNGSSVVRAVWKGKANLGELNVAGSSGRITGLSLRLYNPSTRQWSVSWANASDGLLTQPLIGGFTNGRGEFYDQDSLKGRAIYARLIFSQLKNNSFRIEQAFSADGGRSWEVNWVATFERSRT